MKSSESTDAFTIVMLVASLPPLPSGGAELQALSLGRHLTKSGHKVIFVTPGKGRVRGKTVVDGMQVYRPYTLFNRCFEWASSLKKKHTYAPVKIEYDDKEELTDIINTKVGWPTRIYYNLFYWQCLWLLWPRRKKISVIHAHTMEWSVIVASRLAKGLNLPTVVKDSTMNGFKSLARFPHGQSLQQFVIRQVHFVAMTKVIGDNLQAAGVPGSNITYIPNGLEIRNLPPVQPREAGTVLFIGNLYQQPAKGIDILLKAWRIVVSKFPAARLRMIGDGDLAIYGAYARQLGIADSVEWLGRVSNPKNYLGTSSVFVLPSRREGMSNALMEAMWFKLPCVVTDISGSNELIRHQFNGLIVPPAEVESLAAAIEFMLRCPEQAVLMGERACNTILESYDMRFIAERYLQLYSNLISH